MPAPLSDDLRLRILRARERGDTIEQIAREKEVSVSAIVRLLKHHRETGSHKPHPLNNGRRPKLSAEQLRLIELRVQADPYVTLQKLIDDYSLPVGKPALCNILNKKLKLIRGDDGGRRKIG